MGKVQSAMEPEPNSMIDPVEEASEESFPASDSPAWAMGTNAVQHCEDESRFEKPVGGKMAYLTYRRRPKSIVFIHTEVPVEFQKLGIGGQLARAGLDFARAQGLEVVPLCPFIAKFISQHREYIDLVPAEQRARVESS
jgi:predicted GNAT family acetyltransferase